MPGKSFARDISQPRKAAARTVENTPTIKIGQSDFSSLNSEGGMLLAIIMPTMPCAAVKP
ncbi:hypothetical protein D3C72_2333930 [compost metagenome]